MSHGGMAEMVVQCYKMMHQERDGQSPNGCAMLQNDAPRERWTISKWLCNATK